MDLSDYEPPNVLFLRGCFLSDCKSIEDKFDEKLLNEGSYGNTYEIKNTTYDKIPKTFTSLESWKKSTNLKCWYCDCTFESVPLFIPKNVEKDGSMGVLGNFCSWNCASSHINLHFDSDQKWEKCLLLKLLYRDFTGDEINEILPAPNKTEMIQYGGKKTPQQFKDELSKKNKQYETAIEHNSIKNLSMDLNRS